MYPKHAEKAAEDAPHWAAKHALDLGQTTLLEWLTKNHMHAHFAEKRGSAAMRLALYESLPENVRQRGLGLLGIFQALDASSTKTIEGHAEVLAEDYFIKDYQTLKIQALEDIAKKDHPTAVRSIILKELSSRGITNPAEMGKIIGPIVLRFPLGSLEPEQLNHEVLQVLREQLDR